MENMSGNDLTIKWIAKNVPVHDLKPFEKNPRKITAEDFESLKRSIQEDGYHQRILCTPDLRVIGGHQRIKALKELGYGSIDILVSDRPMPDDQFRRILVRDNMAYGQWDFDALSDLMSIGVLEDLGVGDDVLGKVGARNKDGMTDPDEIPAALKVPVTASGDVWQLGEHRVMCGSSTNADDVAKLLADHKPNLMVTDPPYGVEYDANWRNKALAGKPRADGKKGGGGRAIGKVSNDDRADWSEAWALFPGDVAYVWHGPLQTSVVLNSLESNDFKPISLLIWAKSHFAIGRGDYHGKHEQCWYVVREGKKHNWNGDRKQTTVWDIDKPQKSETGHSTQKPIECMKRPIENNSRAGDSVYEPFSGSGTTIIAAEMTGRKCLAMELNPVYVDMAVMRWQNFTGLQAIHEASGKTFSDRAHHGQ